MIVKNEENVLARCLESAVHLVDEVVIVDTGSTDNTIEIAKRYTEKIYDFPWVNDFAAARNYSFSKAAGDYCMWLDADDVIEEPQQEQFLKMREDLNPHVEMVMMKYNTCFDDSGAPTFSYYRERLIRNNGKHLWYGQVHEVIAPAGLVVHSEVAVTHKRDGAGNPDRNLEIYQGMLAEGKALEPRHQYYYARELYYHKKYQEALDVLLSFLGTADGWKENKIEACSIASYCYDQLERHEDALLILFRSFLYDTPRAEICCDIGKVFLDKREFVSAAYWYEKALEADREKRTGGFILPDCYDYIPYIQLTVCYDRLGERARAIEFNERAGKCKPDSKAYLFNKNYFSK